MEKLLTREEVARLLSKPESWLKYAERHRQIPFVRVGSQIRYRAEDISRWLKERVVPVAPNEADN